MFSPPLYVVRKFNLNYIISHDYNIQISSEEEKRYYIKQQDNMLFRQVRMITYDNSEFNKYVIFVDCTGGQNKKAEMKRLIEKGFKIGNQKFVIGERSASMVRTAILSFNEAHVSRELDTRITMGISFDKTVISKYTAYRGLMLSSCHCIDNWIPKIVVVKDYFVTVPQQKIKYVYDKKVSFEKDGKQREWVQKDIAQTTKDITINAFDGCGICHPSIMREIEARIGTEDHINSCIIRAPYIKGVIHDMDYEKFFSERGVKKITDYWGVEHDVSPGSEPMIILTEGQYKGIKYFKHDGTVNDWNDYWVQFKKYRHCIGIAKWNFTLESEPLMTRINYQILQDLNLPFEKFTRLADKSIEWYEKIVRGDPVYTYCFLGMLSDRHDPLNNYAEAVLRNPEMLQEQGVNNYITGLLDKYRNQFKCGKLWTDATFKFLAPDLIMLMEHIGGLEPVGCLNADEFYCFDRRGVMNGERLIERNPHICKSEHTILSATNNSLIEKYCSHLVNVAMINCKSITPQRLNGADQHKV